MTPGQAWGGASQGRAQGSHISHGSVIVQELIERRPGSKGNHRKQLQESRLRRNEAFKEHRSMAQEGQLHVQC